MARDINFDNLYTSTTGPWAPKSDEATDWLNALVDDIRSRGREPNWNAVFKVFKNGFPDDAPRSVDTVKGYVRRVLDE